MTSIHLTCGDCLNFDRCAAEDGMCINDLACSGIRNKHTVRCSSCTFYMAVNQAGGICIRLIKTGKEKAQPSDGYDDLVNADDQCRYWSDGKEGIKHG